MRSCDCILFFPLCGLAGTVKAARKRMARSVYTILFYLFYDRLFFPSGKIKNHRKLCADDYDQDHIGSDMNRTDA